LVSLRIFEDDAQNMNLSVNDVKGDLLLVSQFTLQASTKKGNRPSFINAARPEIAEPMFSEFVMRVSIQTAGNVSTGQFGAMMQVGLVNSGPVTIVIDSKNRT
ncbi:MAG: D-tyrosyl-tRNA(Tyr) deacylase, partial [Bacteroidetes bacterium]|nr:D-tyrosyl-tRNA(Tyr) deacylase [Bacteroidota bacterium]